MHTSACVYSCTTFRGTVLTVLYLIFGRSPLSRLALWSHIDGAPFECSERCVLFLFSSRCLLLSATFPLLTDAQRHGPLRALLCYAGVCSTCSRQQRTHRIVCRRNRHTFEIGRITLRVLRSLHEMQFCLARGVALSRCSKSAKQISTMQILPPLHVASTSNSLHRL